MSNAKRTMALMQEKHETLLQLQEEALAAATKKDEHEQSMGSIEEYVFMKKDGQCHDVNG